ncbi:MAG: hypothetical protein HY718_00005, partial [Planctomycetes bacterium]|nr:hypothetical protein [Planctomycetota bacterium]
MAQASMADKVLEMARSYQPACVLAAAADLEIFNLLAGREMTAAAIASQAAADARGTRLL